MLRVVWAAVACGLFAVADAERQRAQVLLASDEAQFEGLAAALASIAESGGDAVAATVVTPEASVPAVTRLARCAAPTMPTRVVALEATPARRLAADLSAFGPSEAKFGNLSTLLNFARFYPLEILPRATRFALYVDVDVVVRCSAARLIRDTIAPLAAAAAGGGRAREIYAADRKGACAGSLALCGRCGGATRGFNAGVFAYDVRAWQSGGATRRLEASVAAAASSLRTGVGEPLWTAPSSQAPMIDVFCGSYGPLPAGWNALFRENTEDAPDHLRKFIYRPKELVDDRDCAWHFKGHPKPWERPPLGTPAPPAPPGERAPKHVRVKAWPNETNPWRVWPEEPWTGALFRPYAKPCCADPKSERCRLVSSKGWDGDWEDG